MITNQGIPLVNLLYGGFGFPKADEESVTERQAAESKAVEPKASVQADAQPKIPEEVVQPRQRIPGAFKSDNGDDDVQAVLAPKAQAKAKPDELGDEAFKEALEAGHDRQRMLQNIKSANLMAAGMAGLNGKIHVTPNTSVLDDMEKTAMSEAGDIKERTAHKGEVADLEQKNIQMQQVKDAADPASNISELYRNLAVKMGMNPDQVKNASALALEKTLGPLERYMTAQEAMRLREQSMAESRALRLQQMDIARQNHEDMMNERNERHMDQDFMNMGNKINAGLASSRNGLGQAQRIVNQAERIQQLIDQARTQKGGPDSRQMRELATSLDSMLKGGMSTVRGTDELMPQTARGKYKSFLEYVTNEPQGQDMNAFMERVADTVQREKDVAEAQRRQIQQQLFGGYQHLSRKDPERYKSALQNYGLDMDQNGNIVLKAPQTNSHGASGSFDAPAQSAPNEIRRRTKDGRIAVFDANKNFLRYE